MKIRRYKGNNREALYRQIHKELGPQAVVVAPEKTSGGIGWNRKVELIAVVDESPAGSPDHIGDSSGNGVTAKASDDLAKINRQQMRQMQSMQATMRDIRLQMEKLQAGQKSENATQHGPSHCEDWDKRFCAWAREESPSLLTEKPMSGFRALSAWLPVAESFSFSSPDSGPHVIVLAGPTGSGKTTTLAKLAAICSHRHKLRVGLITTDTYRVAAVDQIKEYASLLGVELRVVFSASEGERAIRDMSDMDVIFVDTPGRSPGDEMGLAMSRRILGGLGSATVLLTIPATMRSGEISRVMEGFKGFHPDYIVITKVDEVQHPALLTSLPFECSLQMVFVTNGQRVPEDIFPADGLRLASMLLPSPEEDSIGDAIPPRVGIGQSNNQDKRTRDISRYRDCTREVAFAGV